jgi:hypothetical protein
VGGCGKSRVIAALQHFAACWGVGERLRRPACSWAARRCTVCSAHSVPSQLSTSTRTTASRCTTEALKAVLEVLCDEVSMVPPSMLAEIDKCLRVARWTSLALVAAIVAQGKVLRALAVGAVCRRARLHPQRDDHGATRRRSDADHTTGDGEDSMRALDEAPFRVGQASAMSVSKASATAQHAHAIPRRRAAPHLARVSRRAVVPEQRDARGDAPLLGRPRRRRSGAADDRRRRVWRCAACCCAGRARFVDEGAFTVTLMSLLRRERLYRSALGWFGGRPTCAWSRAAPRPSCRSTRRFSLPTCSTATTCTTRRSARREDAAGRRESSSKSAMSVDVLAQARA